MGKIDINFEESLATSLEQLEEYDKGNEDHVDIVIYRLFDFPDINADTVRALREELGATQKVFSEIVGVSVRTVESWEIGRSEPNGSAVRLMQLMLDNPSIKAPFQEAVKERELKKREKVAQ